jgi:hypothetical protein
MGVYSEPLFAHDLTVSTATFLHDLTVSTARFLHALALSRGVSRFGLFLAWCLTVIVSFFNCADGIRHGFAHVRLNLEAVEQYDGCCVAIRQQAV